MNPSALIPDDFKRLPQDGQRFEALTCKLLEAMGYRILEPPAVGPDGGRDVLIELVLRDRIIERHERVVVQCKHYAHSGRAVGDRDIGVFQNTMDRYKAQGYFLITSTRVVENLSLAFRGFTETNYPRWAAFWDVDDLIRHLNEHPDVRDDFFPPELPSHTPPLTAEVKGFLQATGFEILAQSFADESIAFQTRGMAAGEHIDRWYLCLERGVTLEDIKNLHRQIQASPGSRGWIVTLFNAIDGDAQRQIKDSESITVRTLASFYRQMLQYDDYLEELIEGSHEIDQYWVDLECSVGEEGRFDVINYVDGWLGAPARNHLALLGDFGTGKTWFCRYYAERAARQHQKDPDHYRLPILISLRGYAKALKIEQLITDTLVNTYHIDLVGGYATFMHLNRSGRLLLIFDGFDEMEQRVDYDVARRNYEELLRAVTGASKVILTSRPLFFADIEKVLKPGFEVLSLRVFEDEQIREALRKRVPDKWEDCWEQVSKIQRLRDLASRPVMTQIVSQTLPTILDLGIGEIDGAALYRTYVDEWIKNACREDPELLCHKDLVLGFVRDLAWEMFRSPAGATISPSNFRERVSKEFRSPTPAPDLVKLFVLDRASGSYAFPHISFTEYFVADKIAQDLGRGCADSLFNCTLTDGVLEFLVDLFPSEPEAQASVLEALLSAQPGEQTDALIGLLTRLGGGNPVRPIIDVLATTGHTLFTELPRYVVAALGKGEFLNQVTRYPAQESQPQVRHFLMELWSSPAIDADQALRKLVPVIYDEDSDLQVRLHSVQMLGKRQGEKELQTLIEIMGQPTVPVRIRQACIDNVRASSLTDGSIRSQVLDVLHQVIGNDQDNIDFRRLCVTKLARYDSWEALAPLLDILKVLKESRHALWLVSASVISQTSVLSLADRIEQEIIFPNQGNRPLIRDIAHLRASVDAIRANAQNK